jgi:hypothetical protein
LCHNTIPYSLIQQTLETCELQRAQPPAQDSSEDADECVEFLTVVKRLLRVHAAAAAGKASERELTVEEESHFAYVIADVTYTIADISTQLMTLRLVSSSGDGGLGRLR